MVGHGRFDDWTPELIGDCDSYALWIRDELLKYGIEADLIYAKVDGVEPNGDHLVASVNGWILDNRYRWVMSRDELPYTWVSIGRWNGKYYIWKNIIQDK